MGNSESDDSLDLYGTDNNNNNYYVYISQKHTQLRQYKLHRWLN